MSGGSYDYLYSKIQNRRPQGGFGHDSQGGGVRRIVGLVQGAEEEAMNLIPDELGDLKSRGAP